MSALMLEGLMLGLSIGISCLATCLPMLLPLLAAGESGLKNQWWIWLQFVAGRGVAYILWAILSFKLGQHYALSAFQQSMLLFLSAGLMLTWALRPRSHSSSCPRRWGKWWRGIPLLGGLLMGLNLCPPLLVAFTRAAQMPQLAGSLGYFLALFVGTSLYLLPFPFLGHWPPVFSTGRVGLYLSILMALWFLFQGVRLL
jgi:hypothetical protein